MWKRGESIRVAGEARRSRNRRKEVNLKTEIKETFYIGRVKVERLGEHLFKLTPPSWCWSVVDHRATALIEMQKRYTIVSMSTLGSWNCLYIIIS